MISINGDEIDELRSFYLNPHLAMEAGIPYILLPALELPKNCTPQIVDALLCPTDRGDGYPNRLFFSEPITCREVRNWNSSNIRILERNWFAFSWKTNRENLRLFQMVLDHLAALR